MEQEHVWLAGDVQQPQQQPQQAASNDTQESGDVRVDKVLVSGDGANAKLDANRAKRAKKKERGDEAA